MWPAVTRDSTIVGPRPHRPMIQNDSPTRGPPGAEEAVRGWYTTFNEDGVFPTDTATRTGNRSSSWSRWIERTLGSPCRTASKWISRTAGDPRRRLERIRHAAELDRTLRRGSPGVRVSTRRVETERLVPGGCIRPDPFARDRWLPSRHREHRHRYCDASTVTQASLASVLGVDPVSPDRPSSTERSSEALRSDPVS